MNSKDFLKEGFVEDAHIMHQDHEVQMAREECYHAAENAIALHKLLRNISEQQGLDGWVSAKITLAGDYLKTVREYIEYELMSAASQQPMLPIAENRGDDADEESALYSGCYVRDKEDQSNEVFIMRGSPEDRRVQITDRNGSGWNISPSRLVAVDDSDPAISKYFGKNVSEVAPVRIGSKLPQSDTETFGLEPGRGYKINNPKDRKPGDRPRAVQQLIPTQDKKDHIRSRLGKHKAPVLPEQNTAEGMLDNPGEQDSPVAQAIIRRILLQRTDLLSKYGPEKVGAAVDEVADFVGDVDEIGSSDVSGWVRHVEQMLGNMDQGVAKGLVERTGGGYRPSTEPDTPEQAARRQQSLQAYQAQQQAPKPPMPDEEYQRRLQQYKIGGRGAGWGFQPKPEDAAAAEAERAKLFGPPTTQHPGTKVDEQGVAEGLPQTLRKVVPGHAKREIDRKMDAGKFGKTDADKDANFQRYKKIQDKLKEQGVAEGSDEKQSFKVSYHNPKTRQDKVVTIKALNKDEVLDYCANKGYKNVHVERGVSEDDSAVQSFLSKGGKIQQLPYKKPRKADKTDYGSKHIGGSGDKMKASRTGTAAKTQGNKVAGMSEGSACNHTMEGKSCPMHGLKECPGYKSSIEETTAGSVAGVVNPTPKNKAKVGTLFGGTYKQKKTKA